MPIATPPPTTAPPASTLPRVRPRGTRRTDPLGVGALLFAAIGFVAVLVLLGPVPPSTPTTASAHLAYTFASAATGPSVADGPTGGWTPPGSNYAYSDAAPWNAQPGPAIPYSRDANAAISLDLSTEGGVCDMTALHARCVDGRVPGN